LTYTSPFVTLAEKINGAGEMAEASRYSLFRDGLFAGQVHIVTGGGSGIGRCTAHELARLGATVVLVGRKPDKLENAAGEIIADGGRVETVSADIRDEDTVKAAVAGIVSHHSRIHGLVNNAGGQFPSPLMFINKKGFDAVVSTNLTGGFLMMREVFLQSMRSHKARPASSSRKGRAPSRPRRSIPRTLETCRVENA
jgi:citronellol/citronellal dehydrogenase